MCSSKILTDVAKHAMDIENNRKKSIETRAGVVLAFLATTLAFLLTDIKKTIEQDRNALCYDKWDALVNMYVKDLQFIDLLAVFDICINIIMIYIFIRAFMNFIDVFKVHGKYKTIDLGGLIEISLEETEEEDELSLLVAGTYHDALEKNIPITDKKIESFEKGIMFLRVAVLLLILHSLIFMVITFFSPNGLVKLMV